MRAIEGEMAVLGAGVAGLAAFQRLRESGREAVLLEARERLGGRVLTLHPKGWPLPVELGAEFIHGSPPELLERLRQTGCTTQTTEPFSERHNWSWQGGELVPSGEFSGGTDSVLDRLQEFDTAERDASFLTFLTSACADLPPAVHASGLNYIEGFEAADPTRIGVRGLQREGKAEEQLGYKQHRLKEGYGCLVAGFSFGSEAHLSAVVTSVAWRRGEVLLQGQVAGEAFTCRARRALITLPLAVMQAGGVRFDPPLTQKTAALAGLEMGGARRCVLRARRPFWEQLRDSRGNSLRGLHFLFSRTAETGHFPTWWAAQPAPSGEAQIVGWAAARHAAALAGQSEEAVRSRAVQDLAERLRIAPRELEAELSGAESYDWANDPFARGAYSYALVGGEGCAAALAQPIEQTLFFAGEATDADGHHATVYGALRSGMRAADEMLAR